MLDWKRLGIVMALWGLVSFLLCIGWGLVTPASMHMHGLLEVLLPGFEWLSLQGFFIGFAWSLALGFYAGALFALIANLVGDVRVASSC